MNFRFSLSKQAIKMRQALKCLALILSLFEVQACTPIYTWGYDPVVRPEATEAYILGVMARENHDYPLALEYYNTALSYTYSEEVAKERDEIKLAMRNVQ